MPTSHWLILLAVGFLFGSIPWGLIIAKAQGVSVSFVQKSMSKAFMHCYQAVYAE